MGEIYGTRSHKLEEDGWCQQSSWQYDYDSEGDLGLSNSILCDKCFEEFDREGYILSLTQVEEFFRSNSGDTYLKEGYFRYYNESKKTYEDLKHYFEEL